MVSILIDFSRTDPLANVFQGSKIRLIMELHPCLPPVSFSNILTASVTIVWSKNFETFRGFFDSFFNKIPDLFISAEPLNCFVSASFI